jgi:hypothetical protein
MKHQHRYRASVSVRGWKTNHQTLGFFLQCHFGRRCGRLRREISKGTLGRCSDSSEIPCPVDTRSDARSRATFALVKLARPGKRSQLDGAANARQMFKVDKAGMHPLAAADTALFCRSTVIRGSDERQAQLGSTSFQSAALKPKSRIGKITCRAHCDSANKARWW